MAWLRRLLLFLLFPIAAFGQGARYDNFVLKPLPIGGVTPVSGALITVCTLAGTGTPCTPKVANIYSDEALTTPLTGTGGAGTTNSDANGNFGFYITPGSYVISVTGSGITSYTIKVVLASGLATANTFSMLTVGPVGSALYQTIAAAQTACPAAGCTIFVRPDATLDSSTVTFSKAVHIVFDVGSYSYTGTGSLFLCSTGQSGVRISGANRGSGGSGISGAVGSQINITNTAAMFLNSTGTGCPGIDIDYLTLVGPQSGTGKGLYLIGTRIALTDLLVAGFGSDGVTIDGTASNSNLPTIYHVRSQGNGGHGFKLFGLNGNIARFIGSDAAFNTGDGFNIASFGNVFLGTNTNNNVNGYHFLSGAVNNTGFIYGDVTDTTNVRFDAGGGANQFYFLSTMTTADAASGNRYENASNVWNAISSNAFVSSTANPAATGMFRNASTDQVCWRNNANGADVCLARAGASDSLTWPNAFNAANLNLTGSFNFTNLLLSATAPTIAGAGCGGSAASIASNNGVGAFTINVGTAPTAGGCTITMPAAVTAWNCFVNDITTNSTGVFYQKQTGAASTTSVVLQNFSDVAVATAPTANDIYRVSCHAY